MPDRVHWICDSRLTRRRDAIGQVAVDDAARVLGHPVTTLVVDAAKPDLSMLPPDALCAVCYGTQNFLDAVRRERPRWRPGTFAGHDGLEHETAVRHLSGLMLNASALILTLQDVLWHALDGPEDRFFIKPTGLQKPFAGQVVRTREGRAWIASLLENGVPAETFCVVSKRVALEGEFRFVVADRAVVAGSQYRWAGRLDIRSDVLPACREVAERVARQAWQPERVYVCDVAITDQGGKVIALNAFSSSDLYACDTDAVVRAVSAIARSIWKDRL